MRFFDQFKRILKLTVSDPQFIARNALFQGTDGQALLDDVLAHIDALTNDFVLFLRFADVESVDGGWALDPTQRLVAYDATHPQETSTVVFKVQPVAVPIRLRDIGLSGDVPVATSEPAPDTRIEYQIDGDGVWLGLRDLAAMGPSPDLIARTSVQFRVRLFLNSQPPEAGWMLSGLTVFTSQE